MLTSDLLVQFQVVKLYWQLVVSIQQSRCVCYQYKIEYCMYCPFIIFRVSHTEWLSKEFLTGHMEDDDDADDDDEPIWAVVENQACECML